MEHCPYRGKLMHKTKDGAKRQRRSLMVNKGRSNGRTNVYHCDFCNHWHTGRR